MKSFVATSLLAGVLLASSAGSSLAADKVVLTMWHNHPEWKQAVDKIIGRFEQQNPDIEIDLQEIPDTSLAARLNTALAAGEAPDLFPVQVGPQVDATAKAGQILDLSKMVDVSGLTQVAQNAGMYDGKRYAVPVFGSYTVGLYYQKKIFAENDLKPPQDETEFMHVCEVLKSKGVVPDDLARTGRHPAGLYVRDDGGEHRSRPTGSPICSAASAS